MHQKERKNNIRHTLLSLYRSFSFIRKQSTKIMSQSYKSIIEKFIESANDPKLNNLDHFLENDVQKTLNSKVVYNNLQEAREYYMKEQDGNSTSQWAFVECEPQDSNSNTLRARVLHDNKTSDTIYTFSSSGKIQRIDVIN